MFTRKIFTILIIGITLFTLTGCKKFLQEKADANLSKPETLDDLQQMLDHPQLMEGLAMNTTATDECYIQEAFWLSIPEFYMNGYVWDPTLDDEEDWRTPYNAVFYANNVLHNLEQMGSIGTAERRDQIRGAALFIRSHAFYQVAQLFTKQYDPATATTDLGIPLRLNANFNEVSVRSTLQQTYDQLIRDLNESAELLPASSLKTRPNKAAAYGLLARVYLQIGRNTEAKTAADAYLSIVDELIDYNQVNPGVQYPFGLYQDNIEISYFYNSPTGLSSIEGEAKIDSVLYRSFQPNDLRKSLYFLDNGDGSYSFRGKYTGGPYLFTGIATDEIYLVRAEASARTGNIGPALQDLNYLCARRYDPGFVPYAGTTKETVLPIIMEERKKQLLTRGLRWSDLKRLNKEPAFAVTLRRQLGARTFELPPNDLRYVLLIPKKVLQEVDLPQNPR